jgi:hypothetical protein
MKVIPDSQIDTWEWVSSHIGVIPSWAKELIPSEYQNDLYIGKVCLFYCFDELK